MTIFESVDSKHNDKQAAVIIIWPRLMMTEIPNQNSSQKYQYVFVLHDWVLILDI